jgi:hypothetical protein
MTTPIIKNAYNNVRKRYGSQNPSTSPLHSTQTGFGPRVSKLKEIASAGVYGAVAEQIITTPDEIRGAELTGTLAEALIATDRPFFQSIGRKIAQAVEAGDTELERRALKLAEDLSIGLVFDGTMYTATFTGRKVYKAAKERRDKKRLEQVGYLDEDTEPMLRVGSKEQFMEEIQQRAASKALDVDLSVEDLEEVADYLSKDNFVAIEKFLAGKNALDAPTRKYLASINAQKITQGDGDMYNVLRQTAELAYEEAVKAGTYQAGIPLAQSKALAMEFGFKNDKELSAWLTQTQNANTNPLTIYSDVAGISLPPNLRGVTTFVLASRMMLARSASHVLDMAKDAQRARNSGDVLRITATKASLTQAYAAHRKVQSMVNGQANEAGRLLNSFNLAVEGDYKAKFLAQMMDQGGKDFDNLIDKLASESPETIALALSKIDDNEIGIWDKMREYFYNSILSAPDTQIVNAAGTLAVRLARDYFETPVAAAISELRKKFYGPNSALAGEPGSDITFEDAKARIVSQFKREGIGTFISDDDIAARATQMVSAGDFDALLKGSFKTVKDLENYFTSKGFTNPKVEIQRMARRQIEEDVMAGTMNLFKTLRLASAAFMEKPLPMGSFNINTNEMIQRGGAQAIKGRVGKIIRLPLRAMMFSDAFHKGLSQNAALYEGASRLIRKMQHEIEVTGQPQTVNLSGGKSVVITPEMLNPLKAGGQIRQDLMHRIVSNPPPALLEYATSEQLRDVFQEVTKLSRFMGRVRSQIDSVAPGLGTVTVPFIQTPINLVIYNLDRIPLVAMYSQKNRDEVRQPGYARDMQLARRATGISILSLGYLLAEQGVATGSHDFDRRKQYQLFDVAGYQPNAYYDENGKAYIHTRGDPFSMALSLGATIHKTIRAFADANGLPDAARNDILQRSALAMHQLYNGVITILGEKTFLQPLSELAGKLVNPYSETPIQDTVVGALEQYVGNAASATIPFSQLVNRVSEAAYELNRRDNPDDFNERFELGFDKTIALRRRGMEMADVQFNHSPVLRETGVYIDTLRRGGLAGYLKGELVRGTNRSPELQRALVENLGDGPIFPRVNQFGFEMPKQRPVNFVGIPGIPVSRTQGADIINDKNPMFVQGSETAMLAKFIIQAGGEDLRVPDEIKVGGIDKTFKLDPETYYYRSLIQGGRYYEVMSDYYRDGYDAIRGVPLPQQKVQEDIKALQAHAREHATAKTLEFMLQNGKIDLQQERDIQRLEEHIVKVEDISLGHYKKLEEIYGRATRVIQSEQGATVVAPRRIEIE